MTKIAVYGTLRYGAPANHLLRGCKRIGIDKIEGTLYNLGAFPGVKLAKKDHDVPPPGVGTGFVVVDVYELPEKSSQEVVQRIDRYEGYIPSSPDQSLYTRRKTQTVGGHEVLAYEYKWPCHPDLCIPSGDWLSHEHK